MDVSVVVATHGDGAWENLARWRAVPSAVAQGVPVHQVHLPCGTLAEARNEALPHIETEWVCFLDADDELEPGYFDAMGQAAADLRAPAVRYLGGRSRPDTIRHDRARRRPLPTAALPRVAGHDHDCTGECLAHGNWLVIGTLAPTALVRAVGGFREYLWSEDWDLWVRCWQAGASVEAVPAAVYRAHVRADSRNRLARPETRVEQHNAIAGANGLPLVGR